MKRCPVCRTPIAQAIPDDEPAQRPAHRPFCSPRCKRIDLANWLNESYSISRPLRPEDLEDDEYTLS